MVLSIYCPNFPCELDFCGTKHQSAEHAFQYTKALRCGDLETANANKTADGAISALHLGKKIKSNEQWESTKVDVMQEILENKCVLRKIAECQTVHKFC